MTFNLSTWITRGVLGLLHFWCRNVVGLQHVSNDGMRIKERHSLHVLVMCSRGRPNSLVYETCQTMARG